MHTLMPASYNVTVPCSRLQHMHCLSLVIGLLSLYGKAKDVIRTQHHKASHVQQYKRGRYIPKMGHSTQARRRKGPMLPAHGDHAH